MAFTLTAYAFLSILAAFINTILGVLVIKTRPKHHLNRVFGFIVLICVIWPLSEIVLRTTSDKAIADTFARIAWSCILIATALMLHFVSILTKPKTYDSMKDRLIRGTYVVCGVFVFLNFTTDSVINGAYKEYWGYTGLFGTGFIWAYFPFHASVVIYSFYLLCKRYRDSENSIERIQIRYVAIGMSIPYLVGSLMQIIMPILGLSAIPLASTSTIVMDGLIAYAIMRYQFLTITPAVEAILGTKPKFHVESRTYILLAEEAKKAMHMYIDQILHGREGLCVTFKHPEEIRRTYNIAKTPILWLTEDGQGHKNIPPTDLLQLSLHLKDFIRVSADNGILLFDGADELMRVNGFIRVYGLIREINVERSKTKVSIVIPIKNPDNLKLIHLQLKKDDIEREIDFAKNRFHHRLIDEDNYRDIVKDFQKQLVELDLQMSKIEKRMSGEDLEIL
jgi:hypothetical protein